MTSITQAEAYLRRHYRWNFAVNVLDFASFNLGMSFASSVAVLPLFVHSLTESPLLIGVLPAIARVGWLLPQLLTAHHIQKLARNKPFVLLASSMERFQWLVLALVILGADRIGRTETLVIFYMLYIWWALGGGFTATAWQDMIAKIIPSTQRGLFFGVQSAAGGLAEAVGAVIAGGILYRQSYPFNFALCFALAGSWLIISYAFLALTREPPIARATPSVTVVEYFRRLPAIACSNRNYVRFVLSNFVVIASLAPLGFLTVYAVTRFSLTAQTVGLLTGVFFAAQTVSNLIWGILGDRRGHKCVLELATLIGGVAAIIAFVAPTLSWLYAIFALMGVALAGTTISSINLILNFAPPHERPTYIGLTSTLLAIPTSLSPLLGGWIVQQSGYGPLFAVSASCALVGYLLLHWTVVEPRIQPIANSF